MQEPVVESVNPQTLPQKIGLWPGGTVVDLAVDGTTVLVATFAGIYRSTDGGGSWSPVDADLPDWFIQAVALAPMEGSTIALAASHMGWLYRSVDGGESWETLTYWRELGVITRLAVSPNFASDGIVFACTEEDGILKSSDRGRTWKSASFGLLNLSATCLVFSPDFAEDEAAYAGTDGGGHFRSRNAGRAWRESGEGLPNSAVQCLAISPRFAQDGVLFAGTEDRGLYRSQDEGRTWSPIGESLAETCINSLCLTSDWESGGKLIAATDEGILVSTDAGFTWQVAEGGPEYPYVIVHSGEGWLAGAYDEGVYFSSDGHTWQACNRDLAAHLPPIVCFSETFEQDGTLLMASMEGMAVRSEDAGQTWRSVQSEGELVPVSLLAGTGKGATMTLLAAADADLLCSRDSGQSWASAVHAGDDPISVLALSKTYDRDRTMLAGTAGGQILLSSDGGVSWEQGALLEGETIVALTSHAQGGGRATSYAVTARQAQTGAWQLTLRASESWEPILSREAEEPVAVLYASEDGRLFCAMGQSVSCLKGGEIVNKSVLEDGAPVSSLVATAEVALAGTRAGLYRSTDHAGSWEAITREISVVALHVASPERAYAASMGGQLWEIRLPR